MRFACVLMVCLAGTANAQSLRERRGLDLDKAELYSPSYNADGSVRPGITITRDGYREVYFSGGRSYKWGYKPMSRYGSRRTHSYRTYTPRSGGLYDTKPIYGGSTYGLTPQPWMFYYEGMELTPYNINSPIWGW